MRTHLKFYFLIIFITIFAIACSHSSTPTKSVIEKEGNSNAFTEEPDIFDNFTSQGTWVIREIFPECAGTVVFGADNSSAEDGKVVRLARTPNQSLGLNVCLKPKYSMEIRTKDEMSYGRYEVRVKAAGCGVNNKEIVTGIFTYWNKGEDLNDNGIIDNSEIDIEMLCSDPTILSLTVWTDYDGKTGKNQHVTREVHMTTGEYYQTEPGKEGEYGTSSKPGGEIEGLPISGFDSTTNFYDVGFEWSSSLIRYFIVYEGKEITLWNFTNKARIPTHPARFMLNVWRDNEMWFPDSGTPSKNDATMEVDWFKYWKE